MILSEPFFLHYTMNEQAQKGFTGSAYVSYRFNNNYLALQGDISYTEQGGGLHYTTTPESGKDFKYDMLFKYQFMNISGIIKLYPMAQITPAYKEDIKWGHGLYAFIGPQVGINIASDNIKYVSEGKDRLPAFGSDLEQQQQLRNVLKGKTNFGFVCGLGYEFKQRGIVLEARCFRGLTDVTETLANTYNFIETKNINNAFQFSIGWDFSSFNGKNHDFSNQY
ncbi:MAG: hypothetical protein QM791_03260 [Ferruginibacter sp.]